MKKSILIIFLFICSVNCSLAQLDTYTQYFDGADSSSTTSLFVHITPGANNIWQVGKPQKIIFDSAATLPNALVTDTINNYPANNTSRFTFSIIPWATHGILGIQWMQKIDMEKKHSGGLVEFSVDNGVTFQSAFNNPHVYNFFGFDPSNQDTLLSGEYAFSGTDSGWKDVWLCYDMSWLSMVDSIIVRYTFKSDGLSGKEGWMIDNMNAHVTIIHPVKETQHNDYFNVYPNPAKNIVHIELNKMESFHIIENMQLINSAGKVVQEWNNIPTRYWIDVSKYAAGMYYLKIKSNLKTKTVPITIQK